MLKRAAIAIALALTCSVPSFAAGGHDGGAVWKTWHAENVVSDTGSLQRGARNFMNYCAGCHSLKYMRYQRMGVDLRIGEDQLKANLLPAGAKITDYMLTSMPAADAETWFGKAPPDLSLITRSKGPDYVFQFLKTFYADPSKPTGVNNLALDGTAMPHVLSDLQGLQGAKFKLVDAKGADGAVSQTREFEGFETLVAGHLSETEYDSFLRDTVNFLDYVGEPTQEVRKSMGIWVVLFLLAFTGIAYLLKQEYWKDVK